VRGRALGFVQGLVDGQQPAGVRRHHAQQTPEPVLVGVPRAARVARSGARCRQSCRRWPNGRSIETRRW
jgi:hypothetical protein